MLTGGLTTIYHHKLMKELAFSTSGSFAALKKDGSVITFGDSIRGGDSSEVADKLSNGVIDIVAGRHAYAALKEDGSVVTWGLGLWRRSIWTFWCWCICNRYGICCS